MTEPAPVNSEKGHIVAVYVMADLMERVQKGLDTYGTPLQTDNGRNALQDLYEELLDAAMYIKQKLLELDDEHQS